MAETGLTQTAAALRREEDELKSQRQVLATQVRGIDFRLRRLRAARRAIGLRLAATQTRSRALDAKEVEARVMVLRQENPRLTDNEIAAAVTRSARDEGRSLAGLHLRLAHALRTSRANQPDEGRKVQQLPE